MKEAYLYSAGVTMLVFETAKAAAKEALRSITWRVDEDTRKELLTNVDGLRIMEVAEFDEESIVQFLKSIHVGGRLILNIFNKRNADSYTVKIEKLAVIKEESNAKIH